MTIKKLDFKPCDSSCPAVTGKPYGSVKYCPMTDTDRHRGLWGRLNMNAHPECNDIRAFPSGEHPFYDHEDYTDCCLNFQCCPGDTPEETEILNSLSETCREIL